MSESIPAVSVLIPCYNDQSVLPKRFAELYAVVSQAFPQFEIVILDDRSADDSWRVLQLLAKSKKGVRLLRHDENMGIAKTFSDLYAAAKHPYVVTFSFDVEWEIKDIPLLIAALKDSDLVVGQRKLKAYPWHRHVISWSHNMLNRVLFGVDTFDAQSIKAMRREIITDIPLSSQTVYYEAERVIRAIRLGYRVRSLPIRHYASEKLQHSGWRVRLVGGAFLDMIALWFRITFYEQPIFSYRHNR